LLIALAAAGAASGCIRPAPGSPETRLAEPDPDSVEVVVFLIGDAGEALPGTTPVAARLQREVEAWSGALGRDSAVAVIFLGDNVYPVGIREPTHPEYALDTLRLRSQLDVLAGPNARRYQASGYFVPGNHDWGNLTGTAGLQRLTNQQDHIDRAREEGLLVRLAPIAGRPGPAILDLGSRLRILFLDTHWWLQAPRFVPRIDVLAQVEEAIRTADGREVMITAHHPFVSGGSHGGPMPIWEGLGILWLLRQTGSLVQDLNSAVYRELLDGLHEAFRRVGAPLIFAGGHDHSLQVLEDVEPGEPHWSLVSGAGSKSTEVAYVDGMHYADDVGGFMRLSVLRNGNILLHVLGTSEQYLHCAPAVNGELERCIQEGLESFDTVFSIRLK
jgi:hypothetical protein